MDQKFFEAKIDDIDTDKNTCSLKGIGQNAQTWKGVPLPQLSGSADQGVYIKWERNTRVVAVFAPSIARNPVHIVSVYCETSSDVNVFPAMDTLADAVGNPDVGEEHHSSSAVLRGSKGSDVEILNSGDISMSTSRGTGVKLKRREWGDSLYNASHTLIERSNAHGAISGTVIRVFGADREGHVVGSFRDNEIRCDYNQDNPVGLHEIGMFTASWACDSGRILDYSRNPRRSEYVLKINEYSEQSLFESFDGEPKRHSGELTLVDDNDTLSRNRRPGNRLHMPENELIEIIGGNIVDINGNVLDINYNKVVLGTESGGVPTKDKRTLDEVIGVETRLRSRREIGYHFQLSTNVLSTDKSSSSTNFVFDIDKEGVLKVNVPRSSSTGNIPFSSTANYTESGDDISIKYENPSRVEPVPITLWSDVLEKDIDSSSDVDVGSGEYRRILLPKSKTPGRRSTGVEFQNTDKNQYFPPNNEGVSQSRIRINTTKYHNMYAAAERLIANRIDSLNMVKFGQRNLVKVTPHTKQFEVLKITSKEEGGDTEERYPANRSVAIVNYAEPAIHPGGYRLVVSGSEKTSWETFSNAFTTTVDSGAGKAEQKAKGHMFESTLDPGGRSANINFDGSLEMSVGKDNYDQKSIVLDTAGSLIAWLGKDKNERSAVIQTDGEVLLNIGGSYGKPEDKLELKDAVEGSELFGKKFNPGRLDIRVNVSDKGFVETGAPVKSSPENLMSLTGDYIISISEKGLVIAGCNTSAPMLIRNDGDINIEATNVLSLYGGNKVEITDGQQKPKTVGDTSR